MIRAGRARTACGVIALATVALLASCAGGEGTSGRVVEAQAAVLHAGDMPRGYREGDDTVCGVPSATEGEWPQLEPLFWETQPDACMIELNRIWAPTPSQPGGVTSAAFVFHDTEDAQRGYRAQVELLRFTASLDARRNEDAELGDEAQLVQGRGLNRPAVAVVWRSGVVVALLAVEPGSGETALELARRQHQLIQGDAAPAPPVPPTDDLTLPLDDPGLELPVYWLGATFAPGRGLPRIKLWEVYASPTAAELGYGATDPGRHAGVRMVLSSLADWERWRRTRLGRLVWDSPCARKTVVQLPGGHAEIFEGYGVSRPVREPCPSAKPDRVVAHVYLEGVVVTVNMPFCYTCGLVSSGNPYDTVAAMTAVVRSLKLRRRS